MKSFLQLLENNEAILLMYLADELPRQDRAEVEQMLASDERLRAELENLRQTHQLAYDALRSLDSSTRPPIAPVAAQNRVMRLMRDWMDNQRGAAGASASEAPRFPWWRTSFATAAAMMIGYYIWAVYHAPPPSPNTETREVTDDDRFAVLQATLEETPSEEANLHVAEVAAATTLVDGEDQTGSNTGAESNIVGSP